MIQNMNSGKMPEGGQMEQMKQLMNMQQSMVSNHVEESVDVLLAKLKAKGHEFEVGPGETRIIKQPADISKQLEDIENMQEEKEKLAQEVEERDQLLEAEQEQKKKMEELLQHMEEKMVTGGQALEQKEREIIQQKRKMQLKLKKQRNQQKELLEEKMKEKEEKLWLEQQYNSVQDQAKEQEEIITELRSRYKGALEEIDDLQHENENKHAEILSDLRDTQQELSLFKGLVDMMLTPHELQKIRQKCSFDEEADQWNIPPFYMKNKEVQLP